MLALVTGHQASGGGHHPPPRVVVAGTREEPAHGAGGARPARLGGDVAVGHDIALLERQKDVGDRRLELGHILSMAPR